jgi:hypothetical protein
MENAGNNEIAPEDEILFAPDADIPEQSQIHFQREPIVFEKKFHFEVGFCKCVTARAEDDVFYAQVNRGRKVIWGKFVKGKKDEISRIQTVIAIPVYRGWQVIAAYVGAATPQFPGDPTGDLQESVDFWSTHALIEGALPYHKGTERTTCPW